MTSKPTPTELGDVEAAEKQYPGRVTMFIDTYESPFLHADYVSELDKIKLARPTSVEVDNKYLIQAHLAGQQHGAQAERLKLVEEICDYIDEYAGDSKYLTGDIKKFFLKASI